METIRIKRKFDRQFKEDAVKLSIERKNVSAVARELGIDVKLIRRWKAEQEQFQGVSFQDSGTSRLIEEQKKIRQLEKDLHKQKLENEILKKALGIISSSDR
jgi:transposase